MDQLAPNSSRGPHTRFVLGGGTAIQRKKPIDIAILAVVIASMLLGGFPTVTGYALYMATGYLLVRIWILQRGPSERR